MTRHDDRIRIQHALDAARKAVASTEGWTRDDLDLMELSTHGVIRLLEILGEAANAVSLETQKAHPSVPWRQLVGLRNRLIHGDFEINLDVVWDTIRHDLPPLVSALEAVLSTIES